MAERGRRFLVTGACGGLGSAVTGMLSARGASVFSTDSDEEGLRSRERPPSVTALPMDVTDCASVREAVAAVRAVTDGLDGVACCAGIFSGGPLVEVTEEEMRKALDVNLMGVYRVVKEAFPLLARRGGTVVAVSSESVRCIMPFNGPYTVSKCALEAYADVLRRELALFGVRVAVVQPGAFRTNLLGRAGAAYVRMGGESVFHRQVDRVREMLDGEWRRAMTADRVAAVVVRALTAGRPRPRYRVGNDPLRALLGTLPTAFADAIIKAYIRTLK